MMVKFSIVITDIYSRCVSNCFLREMNKTVSLEMRIITRRVDDIFASALQSRNVQPFWSMASLLSHVFLRFNDML